MNKCRYCNKHIPNHKSRKYCSRECRKAAQNHMPCEKYSCEKCGKEVTQLPIYRFSKLICKACYKDSIGGSA